MAFSDRVAGCEEKLGELGDSGPTPGRAELGVHPNTGRVALLLPEEVCRGGRKGRDNKEELAELVNVKDNAGVVADMTGDEWKWKCERSAPALLNPISSSSDVYAEDSGSIGDVLRPRTVRTKFRSLANGKAWCAASKCIRPNESALTFSGVLRI